MATSSIPVRPLQLLAGHIAGVPAASFGGVVPVAVPHRLRQDFRIVTPTTGTITDRVMVKDTPTSPERPFPLGRVWVLRLADGYKAWEGHSDAAGWYTATGLEVGVEYVAVGIDPWRQHKAVGAGPVRALRVR